MSANASVTQCGVVRAFLAKATCCLLFLTGCAAKPATSVPNITERDQGPGQTAKTTEEDEGPIKNYRRRFGVVIGINGYRFGDNGWHPLQNAANDASAVAKILREEFGFDGETGELLLLPDGDKAPTASAIREALTTWLPTRATSPQDCVLFFFAGHADEHGPGYLAAIDSKRSELEGSCISLAHVRDALNDLKCRHKAIVLDCCYAGHLFDQSPANVKAEGSNGRAAGEDDVFRTRLEFYLKQRAFWGLAAAQDGFVKDVGVGQPGEPEADSVHDANENSPFTAALLQELRDRCDAKPPDCLFKFSELASNVRSRLDSTSNPIREEVRPPSFGRIKPVDGDGEFIFFPTVRRATPTEQRGLDEYCRLIEKAASASIRNSAGDLDSVEQDLSAKQALAAHVSLEWHLFANSVPRARFRDLDVVAWKIDLSRDGRSLLGIELPGTKVTLWDVANNRLVQSHEITAGRFEEIALSATGNAFVTVSSEALLAYWEQGKAVSTWSDRLSNGPCVAAGFSADGRFVCVLTNRAMRAYNTTRGTLVCEQLLSEPLGVPTAMDVDSGTETVAIGFARGGVQFLGMLSDRQVSTIQLDGEVQAISSLSPDRYLAVCRSSLAEIDRRGLRVVRSRSRLPTAEPTYFDRLRLSEAVSRYAFFVPRNSASVVVCEDILRDVPAEEISLPSQMATWIAGSEVDNRIAVAFFDRNVRFWNRATGAVRDRLEPDSSWNDMPMEVAISHDGTWLAAAGEGRDLGIWDIRSGRFHRKLTDLTRGGLGGRTMVFVDQSSRLACIKGDTLAVLDCEAGDVVGKFRGESEIRLISATPMRPEIVIAERDKLVVLTSKDLSVLRKLDLDWAPTSIAVSTCGSVALGGDSGKVVMFDNNGVLHQVIGEGNGESVPRLEFGPDGEQLAVVFLGGVEEFAEGSKAITSKPITSVTMSDAMSVFQNGMRSYLSMWNVASRCKIWGVPVDGITCTVSFSPDGQRVVSGGMAAMRPEIKVWDVLTGRHISDVPLGPAVTRQNSKEKSGWFFGAISSIALSGDGRYMVSGGTIASPFWKIPSLAMPLIWRLKD